MLLLFPERNLNPKAACLKRREEEKTEELPGGGHHMGLTPNAADLAQNSGVRHHRVTSCVSSAYHEHYFINLSKCCASSNNLITCSFIAMVIFFNTFNILLFLAVLSLYIFCYVLVMLVFCSLFLSSLAMGIFSTSPI